MARLFGFSIEDTEKTPAGVVSPVPPNNQDGSEYYVSSGFYGSYVDIEGVYRTENDLLRRYRQMCLSKCMAFWLHLGNNCSSCPFMITFPCVC